MLGPDGVMETPPGMPFGQVLYHKVSCLHLLSRSSVDRLRQTMNDQSEAPDECAPHKSRLDLEVEEILRKSDNLRQFPQPGSRPARMRAAPGIGSTMSKPSLPVWARRALETPLLVAVGLAILSFLVADASPLLASLLALAAVIFVVLPLVQRFRRPGAAPETKMWRGRVIETRRSDSVIESLKEWWKSRKQRP